MTKEELKKEFEKYLKDSSDYYDPREPLTERKLLQMWLDCAEPREKQIQIDAEQIRALQKQNGELTDKVRELEEKLEQTEKDLADYQFNYPTIKELEAQIEKMKCCSNCDNWNWKHSKCEKKLKGDCFKQSKWILRR